MLRAVAEDEVDVLRQYTLDAADVLGIVAELQDGGGLGMAGELGIRDLIRMEAEIAGAVDLGEEVGVAAPGSVEEGGLCR